MSYYFKMWMDSKVVVITQERFNSESKQPVWSYEYYGGVYGIRSKNFHKNCSLVSGRYEPNVQWSTRDGIISTDSIEKVLTEKPYNFTSKQLKQIAADKKAAKVLSDLQERIESLTKRLADREETISHLREVIQEMSECPEDDCEEWEN